MGGPEELVGSVGELARRLDDAGHPIDEALATALFCAVRLRHPLLLEGEAGVGKTRAAKSLATVLDTPLLRLQCYEGLDSSEALYEWDDPRQLLGFCIAEASGSAVDEQDLFGPSASLVAPCSTRPVTPGPAGSCC